MRSFRLRRAGAILLAPGIASCVMAQTVARPRRARASDVASYLDAALGGPVALSPTAERLPWESPPRTRADMPRVIDLSEPPLFYSRRDDPDAGEPAVDQPDLAPPVEPLGWYLSCGPASEFLVPSDRPFSDPFSEAFGPCPWGR